MSALDLSDVSKKYRIINGWTLNRMEFIPPVGQDFGIFRSTSENIFKILSQERKKFHPIQRQTRSEIHSIFNINIIEFSSVF